MISSIGSTEERLTVLTISMVIYSEIDTIFWKTMRQDLTVTQE